MGGPVRRHRKPLIVGQAPLRHSSPRASPRHSARWRGPTAVFPPFPRPLRHSRAPSVIPAPPPSFPRKRESRGGGGVLQRCSPPHPTWIPAFAGMTGAGRPRSFRGRQTCWRGTPHGRNTSRALFTSASFPHPPPRHSRAPPPSFPRNLDSRFRAEWTGAGVRNPGFTSAVEPGFRGRTVFPSTRCFPASALISRRAPLGTRHAPCSPPRHSRAPSVIPAKAGIQGRWRGPRVSPPHSHLDSRFRGNDGCGAPALISRPSDMLAGNSTR